MLRKEYFSSICSIILTLLIITPVFIQAQTAPPRIEDLQHKIDELSKVISRLETERATSPMNQLTLETSKEKYTGEESLRLKVLKRRQKESRTQIDALTQEIIELSNQLKDPSKRYALAKKLQQTKAVAKPVIGIQDTTITKTPISARSIDLTAIKLVRKGKTLDQARLLTIDQFSLVQINSFYHDLAKPDRHELYDIADDIVNSDGVDLTSARRSAIYLYLFAK